MSRFVIDPDVSQVRIEGSSSVHPIRAEAVGLTGWFEMSMTNRGVAATPAFDGELRIDVDRLRSGNPLVDRETRRRIDAGRHPEIVGTVATAERRATDTLAVTGEISFRGEVREVSGDLVVSRDGDRVVLAGTQSFDVREWGLRLPRLGLLRVHPDVDVTVHLVADPSE